MLKIKDNVDLKELEKFNFQKCGNIYYYLIDGGYGDFISVNISNRVIMIGIVYEPLEDILFDLIQSGLVEKVEV